jgi:hypothetical protein
MANIRLIGATITSGSAIENLRSDANNQSKEQSGLSDANNLRSL